MLGSRRVYPRVCGGARAGSWIGHLAAVYPRVCGGAQNVYPGLELSKGLSPRVRGSLKSGKADYFRMGSIPACAGEPVAVEGFRRDVRVYPRVCGGARERWVEEGDWMGLSPRVRGSLQSLDGQAHPRGSIPACAGEPASCGTCRLPVQVYPACAGEPS